ncbi:MAG: UDP-N-acetylmuramate--L-alanine ligase [Capsulimonadales bacterium]|nr:UDP-N-acetylmuramate--L-alanine ligase [Capsulimonadales bacterium]
MLKKEPVPATPRPLPDGPLYFVGIGGAGMSAIARVLAQRGREIAGSDPGITEATRTRLESVGVTVYRQHDPMQVGEAAAVVATDAVDETNPEIRAARERGIPVFRRPEALGAIFNAGRGIAIAGTHGKTTTTGMVASLLLEAAWEPTILIGGDLPRIGGNARNGDPDRPGGDIVLAEACEAYDGFLYLHPEIAVITNIEADHLDYHGTEEAVFASFRRFVQQIKPGGTAIVSFLPEAGSARDPLEGATRDEARLLTYGERGAVSARNMTFSEAGAEFDLHRDRGEDTEFVPGVFVGHVRLKVPGQHNVLNALAAAAVGFTLGLPDETILAGLDSFTGTGRRFERLGEANGAWIIDDYAHHPTEIRATLAATRSAFPDRRLIAIFQPHLPSRTRDFMEDFADALKADLIVLTDIYLARERPLPGVSSETLAARVRARQPDGTVLHIPDKNDIAAYLTETIRPGDIVLTMGAGDIRKAGEQLLARLRDTQ